MNVGELKEELDFLLYTGKITHETLIVVGPALENYYTVCANLRCKISKNYILIDGAMEGHKSIYCPNHNVLVLTEEYEEYKDDEQQLEIHKPKN